MDDASAQLQLSRTEAKTSPIWKLPSFSFGARVMIIWKNINLVVFSKIILLTSDQGKHITEYRLALQANLSTGSL